MSAATAMLITCILTSFNRPTLVRQALQSVRAQTYQHFELLVFDDSSIFDIKPVVDSFGFGRVKVIHTDVTPQERAGTIRLSINCNKGLQMATGDLVCFLCDDDYFFPRWFEGAVNFFKSTWVHRPYVEAAYGKLVYSHSMEMVYPKNSVRFPGTPVERPACVLDHNQVIHKRFNPPLQWPEKSNPGDPDAKYFSAIANSGRIFYPINDWAVVKRVHAKNLQSTWVSEISKGKAENPRE